MKIKIDGKRIYKSFGSTKVLKNVSVSILPGECIGILGPSGAGKSTLLKCLNGFHDTSKGDIFYNEKKLDDKFDEFRREIGYVPQDDIIHRSLSVYKVFYYSSRLRLPEDTEKKKIELKIQKILKILELSHRKNTKVKKLSGGQRKRVNIGVELLDSPSVLFLDEPTSGLDPALEEKMMTLFRKLADEGRTIILTTHIMESVNLLDLIIILYDGHIVFFGSPDIALKYFKVDDYPDIYKRINERKATVWASRFKESSLYQKFVLQRFAASVPLDEKPDIQHGEPKKDGKRKEQIEQKEEKKDISIDEELERMKNELDI